MSLRNGKGGRAKEDAATSRRRRRGLVSMCEHGEGGAELRGAGTYLLSLEGKKGVCGPRGVTGGRGGGGCDV